MEREAPELSLPKDVEATERVFAELERLAREEPELAVTIFTGMVENEDQNQRRTVAFAIDLLVLADREAAMRLWHKLLADSVSIRDGAYENLERLFDPEVLESGEHSDIKITPQEATALARTYYEAEIAEAGIPEGEWDQSGEWQLRRLMGKTVLPNGIVDVKDII